MRSKQPRIDCTGLPMIRNAAQLFARVVHLHREREPFGHEIGRDAITVGRPRRLRERGEGVAVELARGHRRRRVRSR